MGKEISPKEKIYYRREMHLRREGEGLKGATKTLLLGISLAALLFLTIPDKGLAKGLAGGKGPKKGTHEKKESGLIERFNIGKNKALKYPENETGMYSISRKETGGRTIRFYSDGRGGWFGVRFVYKKFGSTKDAKMPVLRLWHVDDESHIRGLPKKKDIFSLKLDFRKNFRRIVLPKDEKFKGPKKVAGFGIFYDAKEGVVTLKVPLSDRPSEVPKIEKKTKRKPTKQEEEQKRIEYKEKAEEGARKRKKEAKEKKIRKERLEKFYKEKIPDEIKKIKGVKGLAIEPRYHKDGGIDTYIKYENKKGKKIERLLGIKILASGSPAGAVDFSHDYSPHLSNKNLHFRLSNKGLKKAVARELLNGGVIGLEKFAEIQGTDVKKIFFDEQFPKLGGKILVNKKGKRMGISFYEGRKIIVFENSVEKIEILETWGAEKKDENGEFVRSEDESRFKYKIVEIKVTNNNGKTQIKPVHFAKPE